MLKLRAYVDACEMLRRDWITVGNMIVRREPTASSSVRQLLAQGYSEIDIQRLCNHEHMGHLLCNFEASELGIEVLRDLAEVFAALNHWKLRAEFPGRRFTFEIEEVEDDVVVYYFSDGPL